MPAAVTGLRVRLNRRVVTGRMHGRGRSRSLRLGAGAGLRVGANTVFVTGRRRGRVVVDAGSFYWLRPSTSRAKVRLGVSGGRARVRVSLPGLGRRLSTLGSGAFRRAVASLQRRRVFRAWLNGRRVQRAFDGSLRSKWRGELSATHGLRRGSNRLTVILAEPDRGTFTRITRRFRVSGRGPLAGAGRDRRTRPGVRLTLDGRASRAGRRKTRLGFRWRVASRPRGAHVRLVRARSVRPVFRADRPGRYRLRLTVSERGAGARAAAATSDSASVTVSPSSLLLPFTTDSYDAQQQRWGIEIGGQRYRLRRSLVG